MDQIVESHVRRNDHLEKLLSALDEGLFVVNAKGEILCVLQDVTESKRGNGGVIAAIEAVIADASSAGRSLMDRLMSRRSDADESGLDGLTDREREVLGLICQGRDDGEMSRTLGLSRNTVRNHIAALYRKIGVNRRAAAIIWARERGITGDAALKPRFRRRMKPTRH